MVALLHPISQGPQIPVDRAVILVGRSPECDAIIDCSSKISRLHCALVQVDAGYFVRDLGSMNGVFVNGQRVEKEHQLTNGVELSIGDVKFQFLENVQPAARQARPLVIKSGPAILADVETLGAGSPPQPSTLLHNPARSNGGEPPTRISSAGREGMPRISMDAEPEIVEAVEVVDDVIEISASQIMPVDEYIEEIVEVVDVIDDIDVIEDVQILDDIDVIEDVEIIPDGPVRPRRPPRLR